jgi:capsular exopolysaccharide synthesis family protein
MLDADGAPESDRRRGMVATSVLLGVVLGLALAGVGVVAGGVLATVCPIIGLSMPVLLAQDAGRLCAIGEGRPGIALASDAAWCSVLIGAVAIVETSHHASVGVLTGVWCFGGAVAAAVAFLPLRLVPSWRAARSWFHETHRIGGRLAAEYGLSLGSRQVAAIVIAGVLGLRALGAVRAGQALLGPVTTLQYAFLIALVPELVRRRADPAGQRRAAALATLLLVAVDIGFGAVLLFCPASIGREVLGASWRLAHSVILPQIVLVIAVGACVGGEALLRSAFAVRRALRLRAVGALFVVIAVVVGCISGSVRVALWLQASVGVLMAVPYWYLGLRTSGRPARLHGEDDRHAYDRRVEISSALRGPSAKSPPSASHAPTPRSDYPTSSRRNLGGAQASVPLSTEPRPAGDRPAGPNVRRRDGSMTGLAAAARRHALLMVICLIVPVAVVVAIDLRAAKTYSAEAKVLFYNPQIDQKLFSSSFLSTTTTQQEVASTNLALLTSLTVARRAGRGLDRSGLYVQHHVSVSALGVSDVATVTATSPTPPDAARLANAVVTEYIAFREEVNAGQIDLALAALRNQLAHVPANSPTARASRASLQTHIDQLRVLAGIQTGDAQLVQSAAAPTGASSPRPARDVVLAIVIGLLLGAAAVVTMETLDRRIRTSEEAEAILDLPLLAEFRRSPRPLAKATASSTLIDDARTLRANLRYFNVGRPVRSVLVTSAKLGEGKSTVALALAQASAIGGAATLLIEADLRRPTLGARVAGLPSAGLVGILSGDVAPLEAIVSAGLDYGVGSARGALDFLPAGPHPPNALELLESDQMRAVIATACQRYDLVIVDSAPLLVVPDASPLVRIVDGTIAVMRLGLTTRDDLKRLRGQLDRLDARALGIAYNFARGQGGYGAYGYEHKPPRGADIEARALSDRKAGVRV